MKSAGSHSYCRRNEFASQEDFDAAGSLGRWNRQQGLRIAKLYKRWLVRVELSTSTPNWPCLT